MAHSPPHRLPALLAATVAASALAAAPALATEGPPGPPPAQLPTTVGPVTFAPVAAAPAPVPAAKRARPAIRRARLSPKRVRSGKRTALRLSLASPGRLSIVITRGGRRVGAMSVAARKSSAVVRLRARTHGHNLRAGRYRVTVVAIDAQGQRSLPIRLTLTVRAH
jgi:hypothetical protein